MKYVYYVRIVRFEKPTIRKYESSKKAQGKAFNCFRRLSDVLTRNIIDNSREYRGGRINPTEIQTGNVVYEKGKCY